MSLLVGNYTETSLSYQLLCFINYHLEECYFDRKKANHNVLNVPNSETKKGDAVWLSPVQHYIDRDTVASHPEIVLSDIKLPPLGNGAHDVFILGRLLDTSEETGILYSDFSRRFRVIVNRESLPDINYSRTYSDKPSCVAKEVQIEKTGYTEDNITGGEIIDFKVTIANNKDEDINYALMLMSSTDTKSVTNMESLRYTNVLGKSCGSLNFSVNLENTQSRKYWVIAVMSPFKAMESPKGKIVPGNWDILVSDEITSSYEKL